MLFSDEDAPLLKTWIVKRLENTSDADADVLADYVLALLRHDGSSDDVRKLCETEIPDFLKEDSSIFVSDVFEAIQYKLYLPGAAPPPSRAPTTLPSLPATAPAAPALPAAPSGPAQNGSRKRTFQDRNDGDAAGRRDGPSGHGRNKQARRGGHGGAAGGSRFDGPPNFPKAFEAPPVPGAGAGLPTFNANNALGYMMGMPFGLPPTPNFTKTSGMMNANGPGQRRRNQCRDYVNKGYCTRGNTCVYEHGTDNIYVPSNPMMSQIPANYEYNPATAGLPPVASFNGSGSAPTLPQQAPNRSRGGGHGRRRGGHAPFSAEGPVHDRSKSTIVVENIPEEKFSEEEVRKFFSQFGSILEVQMQAYKHLAILRFDSWHSANAAWKSPQVIFENRFVKVYWYKEEEMRQAAESSGAADTHNGPGNGGGASSTVAGPEMDMEEFARKQEEAQRLHEEKKQKLQGVERQKEELERRQKELLEKQQAEKQKLLAKIATMSATGTNGGSADGEANNDGPGASSGAEGSAKTTSQTETLRAQLALLEEEAKQLGLDPKATDDYWGFGARGGRGRGRGRGFYRGRGFAPRGMRGGRGGSPAAFAAHSLDNRPKSVAVTGIDFTAADKDEQLRQFLMGIGEFTSIDTSPTVMQIAFRDRKTAEKFYYSVSGKREIPGIEGQVELQWVKDAGTPGSSSTPASVDFGTKNGGDYSSASALQLGKTGAEEKDAGEDSNMDYDVTDDHEWAS